MSQPHPFGPSPVAYFNKSRVEGFSDGVFAIALTLLILDVKIPTLPNGADPLEWSNFTTLVLPTLGPVLISYLLSFVMVGIYCVAHHAMSASFVGAVDRNLFWLNNFMLLGVGFVPFSASVLGAHADKPLALIIYGANLVLMGLLLLVMLSYIVRTPVVRSPHINMHAVSLSRRRAMFALFAYTFAMLVSFWQPRISLALFFVVPIMYLLPHRFDSIWEIGHHHDHAAEESLQNTVVEEGPIDA